MKRRVMRQYRINKEVVIELLKEKSGQLILSVSRHILDTLDSERIQKLEERINSDIKKVMYTERSSRAFYEIKENL